MRPPDEPPHDASPDPTAGDPLQDLYVASYRRLVAQLLGVTGDLAEAEDVVQEAFARAVLRRRQVEATDSPEAWVRTVAVNLARRRWRRSRMFHRVAPGLHEPPRLEGLSPDTVALVRALRELPEVQRTAIALHHLSDLPVAEVARVTGAPEGTVKARLARGRARLAVLLSDTEDDTADDPTTDTRSLTEDRHA